MKIALSTGSYNYIADGVALTLNRLVAYLTSRGHQVMVLAPTGPKAALQHAGELVSVPSFAAPGRSEYRLALGLPRSIQRRLEAFDPDIVHVATPDLLGHAIQGFALRKGWPVVGSYHTRYETYLGYYGLSGLTPLITRLARAFYDRCLEIYVPSESMIDTLQADGLTVPMRLWRRGVDTDLFDPARRSNSWRAARGLTDQDVLVTFVGRFVKEKRVLAVAEVCRRLRSEGLAVTAVFVGDGPERAALEVSARDALFEGFLRGEALAEAYANSDVFCFPSDTETFGNVTLEAMASGVAAVCADATGSRSLVVDGVTGFLAPVGDAEALYQSVRRLVVDPDLRARMGEAGLLRSRAFSWSAAMNLIESRYEALARA